MSIESILEKVQRKVDHWDIEAEFAKAAGESFMASWDRAIMAKLSYQHCIEIIEEEKSLYMREEDLLCKIEDLKEELLKCQEENFLLKGEVKELKLEVQHGINYEEVLINHINSLEEKGR